MKISVIVNFLLQSRFLKDSTLQVSDLTDLLATPIAQDIGTELTESNPYHPHPIAEVTAENDNETLVFTINSDRFDRQSNFDKDEDFEVLWNVFEMNRSFEEFASESSIGYSLEEDIKHLLHKEELIGKFFEDDECYMDVKVEGHEVKGLDKYGLGKPDGLIYRYTVTIE